VKPKPVRRPREATSASEEETFRLARELARTFRGDEVVLLTGELGAGKTVFAKGLASGLGLNDPRFVCSPSYTLLNVYQGRCPIYHFDLYRLDKDSEIRDLDWEDYLGNGVVIVEWAEKLNLDLPAVRVSIRVGRGGQRKIRVDR
jgi:tRNA threonylcarbamoyladenosine biosynthesis protein TsaE